MKSKITGRLITASADDVATLRRAVCHNLHTCTDRVFGRLTGSLQFKFDPMIPVSNFVPQQGRLAVEIVHHHVDVAIIEEVTGCRAPTHDRRAQTTSNSRWYDFEPFAAKILK